MKQATQSNIKKLAIIIAVVTTVTLGAATFGIVMQTLPRDIGENTNHQITKREASTQIIKSENHDIRPKPLANQTMLTTEEEEESEKNIEDIEEVIKEARIKAEQMSKQAELLHHRRKPVYVWTKKMNGVAFKRNLGDLENKVHHTIRPLDQASIELKGCMSLWKGSWMKGEAETICSRMISSIHARIRATMSPIEEAFWNHNSHVHHRPSAKRLCRKHSR